MCPKPYHPFKTFFTNWKGKIVKNKQLEKFHAPTIKIGAFGKQQQTAQHKRVYP